MRKVTKMRNLSKDELQQIAKKGVLKKNKNMPKEELLISLLKTKRSIDKFRKTKSSNAEIEEVKKEFNALRNNFSEKKKKKRNKL